MDHLQFWWLWMLFVLFFAGTIVLLCLCLTGTCGNCGCLEDVTCYGPRHLAMFPLKEVANISNMVHWGKRNHGEVGKFNNGVDLMVSAPTTVVAPVSGIVLVVVNSSPRSGLERYLYSISIDMGNGWRVNLDLEPGIEGDDIESHNVQLGAIQVEEGMTVSQGQDIATLLTSTNISYLHYSIWQECGATTINHCPLRYSGPGAKQFFYEVEANTGKVACCYGCE